MKAENSLRNVKVFQKFLDILNQTAISCSFLKYPQVNILRFPLVGEHAKHNASLCNGDFVRPAIFPEKMLKFLEKS